MSIYSTALERGQEMGKEIGQTSLRIEQICKKLLRGKPLKVIAEELEEDINVIRPIYELALKFAPNFDSNAVIEAWLLTKNK